MPIIGLVNDEDGTNKSLEDALGLMTVASSANPATFQPTEIRGALAIAPDVLPSNPTTGTIAVDISGGNMLKWWDGDEWIACSSVVISGGGGSGIGAGQTINLQQGLPENFFIATSGVLTNIVANDTLPDGLVLNESTGQITGTPTVFGNFSISLTATFSDLTVSTDTVGMNIAEAFPVTFTFDETQLENIPEGVYVDFECTYTPDPNALPTTWDVIGLPDGMNFSAPFYGDSNGCLIYGEPQNTGSYEVTVSATNWTGTTDITFFINVYAYNMDVYGTSSYDGTYTPVDTGYYEYNYSFNTADVVYGTPSFWSYPLRIYENEFDSNLKIFYFDTYGAWVLADTSTFDGTPPLYIAPQIYNWDSNTLPPQSNWYGPEGIGNIGISWVQP